MRKGQYIDLTGQRFGRLTATKRVRAQTTRSLWLCKCDCGNEAIVTVSNLRNGHTQSCGCYCIDRTREAKTVHGGDRKDKADRLYRVWKSMRQRCYLKSCRGYKYYGAKGVTVCDEWNNSYAAFRTWALENGYSDTAKRGDCTIDRIDPYGNYEPGNCRWVGWDVQSHNKRKKEEE